MSVTTGARSAWLFTSVLPMSQIRLVGLCRRRTPAGSGPVYPGGTSTYEPGFVPVVRRPM